MEFITGRNADQCTIVVPREYDSVSGVHLKIRKLSDGGFVVIDPGSSNGTEVNFGGGWESIGVDRPLRVESQTRLRLGQEFETSIDELMKFYHGPPLEEEPPPQAKRKKPIRHPDGTITYVYVEEN